IQQALQPAAPSHQAPARQPPQAVQNALLPPVTVAVPDNMPPTQQRFNVNVNEVNARQFFMGLVQGTPYNMVVHPDVKGKISLDLKNVTVDEVMNTVRDVYGYEFRREGNLFEVLPAQLRSRIFHVNYLNIRRTGTSETRVSSGGISEGPSNNGNSSNASSPTDTTGTQGGGNTTDSSQQPQALSGSAVTTQSDADFWSGLKTALELLVGDKNGRSVVVDAQSGIVVVRAMPNELRDVSDFLSATQHAVQRQVILEAKILEVDLNHGFQSGINWAALGQPGSGKSIVGGQVGGGTLLGSAGQSAIAGNSGNLNPLNFTPLNGTTASAFGGMFTLSLNLNDFNAFIELLKTQGNVQVLSSPRVATVNNQKAVIKVGTDEYFVTNVSTNTSTTSVAGINQSVNVQLTPFFSGVALDVIPEISSGGEVILHVHPSVSNVTEKNKQIAVSTSTNLNIPLAVSSIRESDTIIRAHSGQVVVIGGLMKNQVEDSVASTPVLGDLPMVGSLFRHTKRSNVKSELVILLRPIVVKSNGQWAGSLRRTAQRFRDLDPVRHAMPDRTENR
ncbi:MAG: pilus (MSHA type) biogenesis protein MshL, partial [Gammaproteobacteria bacterium]